THDLGIVAELCDRVNIMYAGRVVETGDTITIYEDHKHPYTEGLLGTIKKRKKEEGELTVIPGFVPDMLNPPSGCRFHPRCQYAKPICSK
ncbi:MAG: hypothetical protein GTO54_09815, partial [Nitrososphaeria archaeon]|nr:hypothetical protein [Nitrososphaeria archaeon]